jgi:ABC-2 type transport system ATP-binding protein
MLEISGRAGGVGLSGGWPTQEMSLKSAGVRNTRVYAVPKEIFADRLERIVSVLRIDHLIDKPVKSLSLGQRMRCEIAASLLHGPRVLFLDEPTIGLDITAKALLREHLKHLAHVDDTTIVLTSHDTGDIEEICERVILIDEGRILLDQPIAELRSGFMATKQVSLVTDDEVPDFYMRGVRIVARNPHHLTFEVDLADARMDDVVGEALRVLSVRDLTIENAPLDTIIKSLYGGAS